MTASTARPRRTRAPRKSEGRMSLVQHLVELRRRVVISALAIVVAMVAGFVLSGTILDALSGPIADIAAEQGRSASLNYPDITSAFDTRLQIAFTVGIVLASPVWLYEIFAFLAPGLTGRERRYIYGFLFSAVPLFLAGCAAGWFVLPHMVTLLTGFAAEGSSSVITAKTYIDFVLRLIVIVGVAFVLPVFLVILNLMGVLPAAAIRRHWRWAILAITLFTAAATPAADVLSMFLLALPMVALYVAAIGVTTVHDRRAARREAERSAQIDAELSS